MPFSTSNQKASQNKPKRPRENDSDTSENKHNQPTASPRFIVIQSQQERSVSSLSPFVIKKVLNSKKKSKKIRSGDLLLENANKKQIEGLLRLKKYHDLKVQVSLHSSLNTCKGIVRCPELKGVSEHEILEEMREQDVIMFAGLKFVATMH